MRGLRIIWRPSYGFRALPRFPDEHYHCHFGICRATVSAVPAPGLNLALTSPQPAQPTSTWTDSQTAVMSML